MGLAMASQKYPRKVHTQRAINHILKKCVSLSYSTDYSELSDIKQWCRDNVGPERQGHPVHEVSVGWVSPETGTWAWSIIDGNHNFWFDRREDKITFVLTFK